MLRGMKTIVVAAAIIEQDGAYLVTRRLEGTHLAGTWEFPGGKCDPGESLAECLRRELQEELGVDAAIGTEVMQIAHDYGERRVQLHFLTCALAGPPRPQLGQAMQWVRRDALAALEFPPADAALIDYLRERQG